MKAYKSLEAFEHFVCGYVQQCFHNDIIPPANFVSSNQR